MVNAYAGLLLTCDVPIKQLVLHIDEEEQKNQQGSFVVKDLDPTHILLKDTCLPLLKRRLDAMQA